MNVAALALALCAAAAAAAALVSVASRVGALRVEVAELRAELRERMPARLSPRPTWGPREC